MLQLGSLLLDDAPSDESSRCVGSMLLGAGWKTNDLTEGKSRTGVFKPAGDDQKFVLMRVYVPEK
ncbi:hypothetical protein EYF80_048019 [Liparis tanakae]|uniref:Uncharacterized protein n=1 Tax=Liparis tanakae TaxID=230148 RepID=A0A4Z2FKY5_9TELE|nr:hypothetical protein EYF80_048019 [Liparis tanakae]